MSSVRRELPSELVPDPADPRPREHRIRAAARALAEATPSEMDQAVADLSDDELRRAKATLRHAAAETGRTHMTVPDGTIQSISRTKAAGDALVRRAERLLTTTRVSEPLTYEKRSPHSYFLDLGNAARHDTEAAERLRRHAKDVETAPEYRDMDRTDGNGGEFVPPQWLVDQFIAKARAGRPYANLAHRMPLPPKTDTIKVPKVTSGLSVGFQTADNAPVEEQDMDTDSVEVKVRTISGQTSAALQLLEQSPVNFDEVIFDDLTADYATKLDIASLRGSGTNGQVKGVHNTPGIVTIAASAVTVAAYYKAIADGIQRVHTGRFQPPTHIVMHPRRWAWLTSQLDDNQRPLVLPPTIGVNTMATLDAVAAEQVVGQLQGLPVVTDASIGITYGGGTNEDLTYVQRSSDQLLYEGDLKTRVLPEVKGQNLTVVLQVYAYVAFTAERYPESVVEITGMTAPSF